MVSVVFDIFSFFTCMYLTIVLSKYLKLQQKLSNLFHCYKVFVDEEAETIAKEWEHTVLQDTLGKELQQLNKCLEQKEVYNVTYKHFSTMTI